MNGNTVDLLLRARWDKAAAQVYFERAIALNGDPETVTIDKSGLNLAALKAINAKRKTPIKIRQRKYLNNLVEQDHRRDQAANAASDGLQEFSLRTHHPWWNRDHAYNSQRSKRLR